MTFPNTCLFKAWFTKFIVNHKGDADYSWYSMSAIYSVWDHGDTLTVTMYHTHTRYHCTYDYTTYTILESINNLWKQC